MCILYKNASVHAFYFNQKESIDARLILYLWKIRKKKIFQLSYFLL